ncbi:hypothetical protein TGAM01_v206956 [Trichoderma gamsii]|uniref:Uncharacterized protein n=1 Tax=Trichoderma gamsii TaxID=398673 RepID=A0A2P4ZJ03_9HYPO|nr:hypothetical protein TGAM01_v206956 [Trichoderma gamsii]PON24268.1 hypothetical protein TGAM01_v206956 [Trichoderma gamsii]
MTQKSRQVMPSPADSTDSAWSGPGWVWTADDDVSLGGGAEQQLEAGRRQGQGSCWTRLKSAVRCVELARRIVSGALFARRGRVPRKLASAAAVWIDELPNVSCLDVFAAVSPLSRNNIAIAISLTNAVIAKSTSQAALGSLHSLYFLLSYSAIRHRRPVRRRPVPNRKSFQPPPNKTPVVGHLHESARKPPAPCDQAEAWRGQSLLFTGTTRGSEFFPSQNRSAQHHPILLSSLRLLWCSRSQVW